jgi:hypothetical protein
MQRKGKHSSSGRGGGSSSGRGKGRGKGSESKGSAPKSKGVHARSRGAGGDDCGGNKSRDNVGFGGSRGDGSPLRRFFDRVMRDKEYKFQDPGDPAKFLQACVDYDDEIDLFFRLTSEMENGERLLRAAAVRCSVGQILPFLTLAGSDQLGVGLSKSQVAAILGIFFKAKLSDRLLLDLEAGAISDLSALSWYVLKLGGSFSEARADVMLRRLKDMLVSRRAPFSQQMQTLFGNSVDRVTYLQAKRTDFNSLFKK